MKKGLVRRSLGEGGFTLIELLIVIGIIGILAAIILVAVDPAKRLGDARDARRFGEVNALLNAILNYTVDNRGTLPSAINVTTSTVKVIGTATNTCGTATLCTGIASSTSTSALASSCANLGTDLVENYISEIPVDPRGSNSSGDTYDSTRTGYYVIKTSGGRVEIGACAPEFAASIKVKR